MKGSQVYNAHLFHPAGRGCVILALAAAMAVLGGGYLGMAVACLLFDGSRLTAVIFGCAGATMLAGSMVIVGAP